MRSSSVAPLLHAKVNGEVPPITVISIPPFPNEQLSFEIICVSEMAGVFVTMNESTASQPTESVTVTA